MAWLDQLIKNFGGEAGPKVDLGAFGKHPGWDDHIDDFGLETEPLLAARQLLYVQGIGGLIDSGIWEKTAEGKAAPPFGHACFWFSEPDLLIARLWASQDRKGRSRYPMVICAHFCGVEARSAVRQSLPLLEAVEAGCHQATSADAVHALLAANREQLRAAVQATSAEPPLLRSAVAIRIGLTPDNAAWQRIIYAIETQLAAYTAGKVPEAAKRITLKMSALPAMAQQMRLPIGEAAPGEAAIFWHDLIKQLLQTRAPMFFAHPTSSDWIDLIVGCPGMKQLVCLKAPLTTIPMVQEVPYSLPEGFAEKAAQLFHEFCTGTTGT